jgi:hypothetical protein
MNGYRWGSFLWDPQARLDLGATFLEPFDYSHFFHETGEGRATGELRPTAKRPMPARDSQMARLAGQQPLKACE